MKNKIAVMTVLTLIGICGFFGFAYLKDVNASSDIGFELSAAKTTYTVGEVVSVKVLIHNKSSQTLSLPQNLYEYVSFQVSEDGGEFKTYTGIGKGFRIDGLMSDMQLQPNKSLIFPNTIFWNAKPEVSHLNAGAAQRITKGRMLTDYAFPKAGAYFVKATLNLPRPGENELRLESAPVKITVTEPEGEDLAVWNKIRNRGDIGYFIQSGDFNTFEPETRENLRREVEELAAVYSTGSIARSLSRGLERLQINEAKRKAALEKLKP